MVKRFTVVAGLVFVALVLTVGKFAVGRGGLFDGASVAALLLVVAAGAVAVTPRAARS